VLGFTPTLGQSRGATSHPIVWQLVFVPRQKNLSKNFTYELVGTLKLTHEKNWEKGDTMTRRGLKVLQALVDNNV
jgi:hypothetical protein